MIHSALPKPGMQIKKVLSFLLKSTIVFDEKYYRFLKKVPPFSKNDNIATRIKYYSRKKKILSFTC